MLPRLGFLWSEASTIELTNAIVDRHSSFCDGWRPRPPQKSGSSFELIGEPTYCRSRGRLFCAQLSSLEAEDSSEAVVLYAENSSIFMRQARLGAAFSTALDQPTVLARNSDLILESVLLVSNQASSLIRVEASESESVRLAHVSTAGSTVSDVPIAVQATDGIGPSVEILSSILWHPDSPALYRSENGAGSPDVYCLLAATPLTGSHVLVTAENPFGSFISEGELHPASEAIDFCDGSRTTSISLDFESGAARHRPAGESGSTARDHVRRRRQ